MAFVVEDGTGLADANSYDSVESFTEYWTSRGKEMSQYLLASKQAALVQSTDHIDLFFGPRLLGFKATPEQALAFPRIYLYDCQGNVIEGVPQKVKNALAEYAYRILTTAKPLVADPVVDPTGLQVTATYKKAGPLEKRVTYSGSAPTTLPPYPKADAWLQEFLSAQGGSHRA